MYSDFQPHFLSTSHSAHPIENGVSSDCDFDDDSVTPVIREEEPSALTALDYLFPNSPLIDWSLSPQTIEYLQSVDRFNYFDQERHQPPFPAEFTPTVIDILYDDMLAVRSESGCVTYQAKRIPAQITLVEFYFDDQLGLVLIHGNTIIDRISAMADLDTYLGRLPANVHKGSQQ
jgi:hypothetical protein